jgi:hypothetical protein
MREGQIFGEVPTTFDELAYKRLHAVGMEIAVG